MIFHRAKIAIVDNSQDEISLFINLMRRKRIKCEISVYFTAEDFLDVFRDHHDSAVPDVLIVSSDLPGMSGLELIRTLQPKSICEDIVYVMKLMTYCDMSLSGDVFYVPRPMTLKAMNRIIDYSSTLALIPTEQGHELKCCSKSNQWAPKH